MRKAFKMAADSALDIRKWCETKLTEEMIGKLDRCEISPIDLYRDYAGRGWLACANVFQDNRNLYRVMQRLKITSQYSSDLCNMIAVNSVCSMLLATFGNERHKKIAREVLEGKALLSFSLTEPEAGSDIRNLKTSAERVAEGWVLQGKKAFATGAAVADYIIVAARSIPDVSLNRGLSLFAVPGDTEGLIITPREKIATNGFSSCDLDFDAVSLPDDAIVGAPGGAWGSVAFAGGVERLMVAATCVGLSQKILSYLMEYSRTRRIQQKPMYDLQVIQHRLVDLSIKVKAADLMVENAIGLLSEGKTPTFDICGAKVFASELQQEISMAAMKIMGGRAYLRDYPVERWLREGLLAIYAGGTNELQKNLIARKLPQAVQAM